MQVGLPGFFKQQTGQAFLLVAGALWLAWAKVEFDPAYVVEMLRLLAGLGAVFIVFEKIRVTVNGKSGEGAKPPEGPPG